MCFRKNSYSTVEASQKQGGESTIARDTFVRSSRFRTLHKARFVGTRVVGKIRRLMMACVVLVVFRVVSVLRPASTKIDYSLWLIGGSNGWYYDGNSAVLHQYICKNHPEIKIYWVIHKQSPHYSWVSRVGPIVEHGSWKALWLSLKAGVQISTHSRTSDIADLPRYYCKRSFTVHLFHGVTGFKRKVLGTESHYADYDMLIATGPREKEIKTLFGCPEDRIVITGFPQHDLLPLNHMDTTKSQRHVLFMPTWRSWLATKRYTLRDEMQDIEQGYFMPILSLLQHNDLMEYCLANSVRIRLVIHRNMQFWWRDFVNRYGDGLEGYVDMLPPDVSIQQELVNASILVTDYSSVAWEFLYMMKPVVFYMFDLDQYLSQQGSYLRLPEDLFGPYARSAGDAAKLIVQLLEKPEEFSASRVVNQMRRDFFAHIDNRNCERVVNEIKKRLQKKLERDPRFRDH